MAIAARRSLIVLTSTIALVSVAGLTASAWMKSPQERMASSAPPEPTTITAPVQHRVLERLIVVRGGVTADSVTEVVPSAPAGTKPIVTAVRVKQGEMVKAGSVLFEVGGRPVIAFPGEKPAYRDLRPGSTGADVLQLQSALKSLGHPVLPDHNGHFGQGTKGALSAYLGELGYSATPTSPDDAANIAAAKRGELAARRALSDAQEDLNVARAGSDGYSKLRKAVERAEEDLKAAEDSVKALITSTGPTLPLSEYAFVPSMPGRVSQLSVKIGKELEQPAAVLSSGSLVVQANVSEANRAVLKVGMKARVVGEASGLRADGVVDVLGAYVSGTEHQESGAPMTVRLTKSVGWNQYGSEVRLTVVTESSNEKVLVVPVSAILKQADGSTVVVKKGSSGEQRIPVIASGEASGYVEVSGDLVEGESVVIGTAR